MPSNPEIKEEIREDSLDDSENEHLKTSQCKDLKESTDSMDFELLMNEVK